MVVGPCPWPNYRDQGGANNVNIRMRLPRGIHAVSTLPPEALPSLLRHRPASLERVARYL